jgi:hypothetical protein
MGNDLAKLGAYIGNMVLGLVVSAFFVVSLRRCLDNVSEKNRKISKGSLWLILIPFFSLYWTFVVVKRMRDSLKAEYEDLDRPCPYKDHAHGRGMVFAVGTLLCFVPGIRTAAGILTFIVFILYWVATVKIKEDLAALKKPA